MTKEYPFGANAYPLDPGLRLIEASAGTGKTFAIAHLVLRLIAEKKIPITEILVVTFTEAAANELKARISKRLENALKGIESVNNEVVAEDKILLEWLTKQREDSQNRQQIICLLANALENIDIADVTTIHGFCRRTLKREALLGFFPIDLKIEGDDHKLIFEVAHEYWQTHILGLSPYDIKGIDDAGISPEKLAIQLLKLDNEPSLVFEAKDIEFTEPLIDQFDKWILEFWTDFCLLWKNFGTDLEEGFKEIASEWKTQGALDTKPFSPKPIKDREQIITEWIKDMNISHQEGRPTYADIRNQTLIEKYYHPAVFNDVACRCGNEDYELINPKLQKAFSQLWDGPAEKTWAHALKWCLINLSERRVKNGTTSYAGLLKALDPGPKHSEKFLLDHESIPPLIQRIRSRYKAALIDEFQDTDPVQWRILKATFGDSKLHLLLMVGDPKQAIYKFRGGSLNTYLSARKHVDHIHILRENFRTSEDLMNGINNLMSKGLLRSSLNVPTLYPQIKEESLPLSKGDYPLQILTMEDSFIKEDSIDLPLPTKSSLEEKISIAIGNKVLELLQSYDNELTPDEICILVNRHEQAKSIREGLISLGIPTRLISQGDIFSSEAGEVLQRFLDCLANKGNTKNLKLVACSPLIQWNAEELRRANEDGRIDLLAIKFRKLADDLPKKGLITCLSELLEGQNLANLSLRGRILTDLFQCARLVEEVIHLQCLDAYGASRWLMHQRLQQSETVPDDRQPHSDMEENAINIMTIHRSKGLEFKVVICPYLWQTSPKEHGPLWRLEHANSWLLSTNSRWGEGKFAAKEAWLESLKESERLAYVAFTRARCQLILLWTRCLNQEGNPLATFLFGPEAINANIADLTMEKMYKWIKKNNIKSTIKTANQKIIDGKWKPIKQSGNILLGPKPKRLLETSWGRSSYSRWISNENSFDYINLIEPYEIEEGRDIDQQISQEIGTESENIIYPTISHQSFKSIWSSKGPLADFPCGSGAGDCLHKILEKIDFTQSLTNADTEKIIEDELSKSGFSKDLKNGVQKGLERTLYTELSGSVGNLRLKELSSRRRLSELSFDLPIAQASNPIRSSDLSSVFTKNPEYNFGKEYSKQIRDLKICSNGFFTGSIDLVFTDKEDINKARWWVADWKSNWLGKRDENGEVISCGPIDYIKPKMEKQMIIHHYPLQAHLYLLALHRFLKWRLRNYSPERNLGGYIYIFLRGLPSREEILENSSHEDIPGLFIEPAPIERILELDNLFRG